MANIPLQMGSKSRACLSHISCFAVEVLTSVLNHHITPRCPLKSEGLVYSSWHATSRAIRFPFAYQTASS